MVAIQKNNFQGKVGSLDAPYRGDFYTFRSMNDITFYIHLIAGPEENMFYFKMKKGRDGWCEFENIEDANMVTGLLRKTYDTHYHGYERIA